MKITNEDIAESLELWNEYFNTDGLMSDDEFFEMTFSERLQMLNRSYPDNEDLGYTI